jgi:hypothetical protein
MKNFIYIIIVLSVFLPSCSSFNRTLKENQASGNSKENQGIEGQIGHHKILKCKNTQLDPFNQNTYYWMNFMDCLKDSLTSKNQSYEEKYLNLLKVKVDFARENEWQKAEVMLSVPLRGDFIFKNLLSYSNIFYCYKDRTLQETGQIRSIHKFYFDTYTSMIRSIDGMQVEDYLEKVVPYTYDVALKDETEKCKQSRYKQKYEIIKKAYAEGKIVLKDYGED